MSTTKSFIYEIQHQISQVFMNKQSWKRLKRRKHENAVEDHLISLHLDAVSSLLSIPPGYVFSLFFSITLFSFLSLFFLNGQGVKSAVWSPTPASTVYFSALLCDWPLVTMAVTLAVGSGGRTSQLLRWTACRQNRK